MTTLMKITGTALLSLMLLSSCNAEEPNYREWLQEGVLIDTRTLEEFNAGHMRGAKLVPYDEISTAIGRHVENKDTPILLYCRSGRRAGIAESVLRKQGYSKVYNVGGIPDIIEFVKLHGS